MTNKEEFNWERIDNPTIREELDDFIEMIEKLPVSKLEHINYLTRTDTQKARLILEEIDKPYFEILDPDTDQDKITCNIKQIGIYCGIVSDYITKIEKQAEELKDISNQIFDVTNALQKWNRNRQAKSNDSI